MPALSCPFRLVLVLQNFLSCQGLHSSFSICYYGDLPCCLTTLWFVKEASIVGFELPISQPTTK